MFRSCSYLTAFIILLLAVVLLVVPASTAEAQANLSSMEPVNLVIADAALKVSEAGMINVLIDCPSQNCAAIDIELKVDPQQLSLDSIILGEFPSALTQTVYPLVQSVNSQDGTAHLIYVTEGEYDAASAEAGLLLQINAYALAAGDTTVRLSNIQVSDFNGSEVDVAFVSNGTVTIENVPGASPIAEVVEEFESHLVTMEVRAEARSSEAISVWGSNSPYITAEPSAEVAHIEISVDADESLTEELVLSAPGHLSCYITAEEFQTFLSSVPAFLLSAGDANEDGVIDDADASIVGNHVPQSGDINGDQNVNVLDLIHVGRNYGHTGGQCQ